MDERMETEGRADEEGRMKRQCERRKIMDGTKESRKKEQKRKKCKEVRNERKIKERKNGGKKMDSRD